MKKKSQIFDGLSSSEVQQVLAHGILKDYDKDSTLFKKGSRTESLFLIVEGQVRIFIEFHSVEIDLTKLGPGDVFGEIAAVTHHPRTASAVIDKKSTLFEFDQDVLANLNDHFPKLATQFYFNLLNITAHRLAETNRKLVAERVERLEASLL